MAFGKKFWRRTFTVVKIVGKVFLVAAAADRIKIKPSERIIIEEALNAVDQIDKEVINAR